MNYDDYKLASPFNKGTGWYEEANEIPDAFEQAMIENNLIALKHNSMKSFLKICSELKKINALEFNHVNRLLILKLDMTDLRKSLDEAIKESQRIRKELFND